MLGFRSCAGLVLEFILARMGAWGRDRTVAGATRVALADGVDHASGVVSCAR